MENKNEAVASPASTGKEGGGAGGGVETGNLAPTDHVITPATAAAQGKGRDDGDSDDDEQDDLDDLDDMLDEFSAVRVDEKKDAPSASGPGRSSTGNEDAAATDVEKEFMQKMEVGKSELLKEMDEDPELAKQMEVLMKTLQDTEAGGDPSAVPPTQPSSSKNENGQSGPSAGGAAVDEESFQDTIRKTMERMQSSGDQATASLVDGIGGGGGNDDILAALLKEMEAGGGLDGASDDDLSKMFLNMMEQLTNREMLYEPMKELHAKFPDWIRDNKGKVPEDQMRGYEEQASIVAEIVTKFDEPGYKDEKPEDRQYIWDRMQKMQAAGSPPEDLIANPLGENMMSQLTDDGMPGCPQQ